MLVGAVDLSGRRISFFGITPLVLLACRCGGLDSPIWRHSYFGSLVSSCGICEKRAAARAHYGFIDIVHFCFDIVALLHSWTCMLTKKKQDQSLESEQCNIKVSSCMEEVIYQLAMQLKSQKGSRLHWEELCQPHKEDQDSRKK